MLTMVMMHGDDENDATRRMTMMIMMRATDEGHAPACALFLREKVTSHYKAKEASSECALVHKDYWSAAKDP